LFVFAGFATAADTDPGREPVDVDSRWGVEIPVADGTRLNGTLYRPAGSSGQRLPTIVTITPYISDRYHPDAQYFARHGFAFLVVDTRGRGNSGGEFRPLDLEDGQDGRDVVQWIAAQPWSNGRIGMRGGSYGGYNQWATARYFPASLDTIVPIAAPYHGVDFPMNRGVQSPYIIRWLTLTSGRTGQNRSFGDDGFWERKFLDYHRKGIRFLDLDEHVGNPNARFRDWTTRPLVDAHWLARVPSPEQLARLDLPILTITGYYDGDQPGALAHYDAHMRHGSEAGKSRHYLVLGPWDHSGTRLPQRTVGGIEFGEASLFDAWALDRDWYRWAFGEGERPAFLKDRVTYFVAGADEWKAAPSLDAISNHTMELMLSSTVERHTVFENGSLGGRKQPDGSSSYRYDPLDTGKAERGVSKAYVTDQSEAVQTAGDGLLFHSAAFDEAVEITGVPRFEGWFEMDVPDTDIRVTLYEILADGSSIALSEQTLRSRYRDGADRERFMEPGVVEQLVFERFFFFSRLIGKGSRLRLFVRPANTVNDQRHYNAASPVYLQTRDDARTATVRLHHSERYPSRLLLPVVDSD
jgi:putative CocE/NonD family hydrolase